MQVENAISEIEILP